MSERQIRYCTTEDGVSIAYCVEGDGPITILALPVFYESFSLDYLMPAYQQFYRELGKGRRIVRFDWRGTGLSADVPYGTQILNPRADLEAVTRSVSGESVIWASTIAGVPALDFCIAFNERVSKLILYGTFMTVTDAMPDSALEALRSLAKANYQIAIQTLADLNGRREYPDEASQLADWYVQSVTPDVYLKLIDPDQTNRADLSTVGQRVSRVVTPTLVLHRIADSGVSFSAGQKLAASIPNARFVPLEGKGHLFCLGDYSKILSAVDEFLGDRERTAVRSAPEASAFRAVLFTDLVGHTEMMSRLGDEKGRDVLREHERITREVLKANGGTEVKTMGDGFMASFGSVTRGVECAIALQRAFADREGEPLSVRVGLNAGEPIEEDGDLFGATVILASRIAAKADGGEILVADTVRGLCSGKGFLFADRGDFVAKGFEEPVRISEVRWTA
ncbi:MAG: adenylate/guanylate cyclase domain-containing protein [Chloroflexota bacterium]